MFTENFTEEELKLYEYATQICDNDLNFTLSNISIVENATDFYQTLHEVRAGTLVIKFVVYLICRSSRISWLSPNAFGWVLEKSVRNFLLR